MKPDSSNHSSFSVQNNLGGVKLMSEKIVPALETMQLSNVVIGLEATSIYGDGLVCALREDGRLGRFQRKIHVLNPKQVLDPASVRRLSHVSNTHKPWIL